MKQEQARATKDQPTFQIVEETLQASEESFRLLAEALPQIVWTALPNGELDYYNHYWYDFTGYTRKETFQHESWANVIHPDDREKTLDTWYKAVQSKERYEIEYRFWDKDEGRYHWFLARALPAYDYQGNVIKWFGTCTDIDKSKQAEEKLLYHASLARNILDAIVVTSLESEILTWNSAAEALYGWKEEEARGKFFDQLLQTQYPRDDRQEWLKEVLTKGYWRGELRQQRRDGAWLDIQTGVSPFRDIDGKIVGLVGIIRDITESKQIERKLQEREQQLQAAIDLAKLGVWKLYLKNNRIECSVRSKAHFGYSADTCMTLGRVIKRIIPEDRDWNLREALEQRKEYHGEYRVKWPDGSLHWIAISGQGQYSKRGKPFAVVGVTLDITERKLEEQRKDTFIGIASHELKTPLTTIKGFTQLLYRQMKRLGMTDQVETLAKMDGQVNALTRLVNELMDVSKIQSGLLEYSWEEIDIDQLVKNVVEMVQQMSSRHIIQISGETGRKIVGDRSHLEQVLTNLLTNAIKYSPQAQQVEVSLGCERDTIFIKVRDYGIGIPAEELERIFGRFYRADTARSRAIGGLGMGLYIAQEIISKHGGKITVKSKEGEGSTFCVELPFSPLSEQEANNDDRSSGGGGTMNDR